MQEVAIVQELLTHYRVPFYERLRPLLAENNINLRLLHGKATGDRAKRADESTIEWAEPTRIITAPKIRNLTPYVWQPVTQQVSGADLVIVEHANRQVFTHLALAKSALGIQPLTALWGHGANLQAPNNNSASERFKRMTARMPHWWFAYTQGSADRVKATGFPQDRITVVQNASDVPDHYNDSTRKDPFHCVYVGSLHQHKRIEFLIEAGIEAARLEPRFRLSIVGTGEHRELVERAALEHSGWLTYVGPLYGSEKSALLNRTALTLNPGLIGLGILDSFAAQAPVVTTDIPFHSPEFEYLTAGENGLVLPAACSPEEYALAVVSTLHNSSTLARLRKGCQRASEVFTIESMTHQYSNGIISALSAPRRRPHIPRY